MRAMAASWSQSPQSDGVRIMCHQRRRPCSMKALSNKTSSRTIITTIVPVLLMFISVFSLLDDSVERVECHGQCRLQMKKHWNAGNAVVYA